MRKLTFKLLFVMFISDPILAIAANSSRDLVGTWHYTENQCTDHFIFSDNGFKSVSNQETIEASVGIVPLPDESPTQLRVDREITFDSLGPDCAGTDKNDLGKKDTRFVKFNNDRTSYLVCLDQQGRKCWGPIIKN